MLGWGTKSDCLEGSAASASFRQRHGVANCLICTARLAEGWLSWCERVSVQCLHMDNYIDTLFIGKTSLRSNADCAADAAFLHCSSPNIFGVRYQD
jgi:hypothetical protein